MERRRRAGPARADGRRRVSRGTRLVALAVVLALSVGLSGCSLELLLATALVAPGGVATYTLELFNDEVTSVGLLSIFTVVHVPAAWSYSGSAFASTTAPTSGFGSLVADPGFVCGFGPEIPDPGAGRKALVIYWGDFAGVKPQTAVAEIELSVGPTEGVFDVDLFVVIPEGDGLCFPRRSATTRVAAGAIFGDGFEGGDLGAWSDSSP